MNLQYFGTTILFAFIGYLIGSISWAVILSKKFKNEDVRVNGSGNAGATNTLRSYGKKIAAVVFFLDMSKTVVAILIAYLVKKYAGDPWNGTIIEVAGIAAIIGHIFPVFFKFKGGKGSASLVGLFASVNWILFFIGLAIFFAIILKSRKVSLGSLVTPVLLIGAYIVFHFIPGMNSTWDSPMIQGQEWWIPIIILTTGWLITVWTHRGNIGRLLKGTERTLDDNKTK